MKIQQQNAYNPNMKALYFSKAIPKKKGPDYINQKITRDGIKYTEDNSAKLTPIMKEAFAENRFIRNLAEKYDVFVQYLGEKFGYGTFDSTALINVVYNDEEFVLSDQYMFISHDAYTPEGARFKLLADINNEKYCNKETYKLDKVQ